MHTHRTTQQRFIRKSQAFAIDALRCELLIKEMTRSGLGIDDIQVKLKLGYGITCDRLQIKKIVLRQR